MLSSAALCQHELVASQSAALTSPTFFDGISNRTIDLPHQYMLSPYTVVTR